MVGAGGVLGQLERGRAFDRRSRGSMPLSAVPACPWSPSPNRAGHHDAPCSFRSSARRCGAATGVPSALPAPHLHHLWMGRWVGPLLDLLPAICSTAVVSDPTFRGGACVALSVVALPNWLGWCPGNVTPLSQSLQWKAQAAAGCCTDCVLHCTGSRRPQTNPSTTEPLTARPRPPPRGRSPPPRPVLQPTQSPVTVPTCGSVLLAWSNVNTGCPPPLGAHSLTPALHIFPCTLRHAGSAESTGTGKRRSTPRGRSWGSRAPAIVRPQTLLTLLPLPVVDLFAPARQPLPHRSLFPRAPLFLPPSMPLGSWLHLGRTGELLPTVPCGGGHRVADSSAAAGKLPGKRTGAGHGPLGLHSRSESDSSAISSISKEEVGGASPSHPTRPEEPAAQDFYGLAYNRCGWWLVEAANLGALGLWRQRLCTPVVRSRPLAAGTPSLTT